MPNAKDLLLRRVNRFVEKHPLTPKQLDEMYGVRQGAKGNVISEYDDGWFIDEMLKNNLAVPGDNHRFYDNGYHGSNSLPSDEVRIMSPRLITDENGNKFVESFHWTPRRNVEGILKNGLVSTLGADAVNFQKRPGVWTSFGDANPMSYNYEDEVYIGEGDYGMEPVRAVIPYEEWKRMYVDHTGMTGSDEVMVFRAADSKPYGQVMLPNGEVGDVAIPPQYLGRYKLPKNWTYRLGSEGWSLPGWNPSMTHPNLYMKDFIDNADKKDVRELSKKYLKEEDTPWKAQAAVVSDIVSKAGSQKKLRENLWNKKGRLVAGPNGEIDTNKLKEEVQKALVEGRINRAKANRLMAIALPTLANEKYFLNTRFNDALSLAKGFENMPRQGRGYVQNGESDFAHSELIDLWNDLKNTRKFVSNSIFDYYPIKGLAGAETKQNELKKFNKEFDKFKFFSDYGGTVWGPGFNGGNEFLLGSLMGPIGNTLGMDYQKMAGINNGFVDKLNDQRMYKGTTVRTDGYDKPVEDLAFDYAKEASRMDKSYYGELKNPMDYYYKQGKRKFSPRYDSEEERLADQQKLAEDWKKQMQADSLDRVIGHYYGRKIGQYRADRGKYGLDK